jgi:hypothetical protein
MYRASSNYVFAFTSTFVNRRSVFDIQLFSYTVSQQPTTNYDQRHLTTEGTARPAAGTKILELRNTWRSLWPQPNFFSRKKTQKAQKEAIARMESWSGKQCS